MDIMVQRILPRQNFKRVPRNRIAAVVVRGFEGGERGEGDGLAGGEAGQVDCEVGAEDVDDELLVDVRVEGTEGVGHIDLWVVGVGGYCFCGFSGGGRDLRDDGRRGNWLGGFKEVSVIVCVGLAPLLVRGLQHSL